jgi:translocation and assembly module TamA
MRWLFLFFLVPWLGFAAQVRYAVHFIGLDDPVALKGLDQMSDLAALQKRPPASVSALRYRAEADVPRMVLVLQGYGYYEAQVTTRIEEEGEESQVFVMIAPGPLYRIERYEVFPSGLDIGPDLLGIEVGQRAETKAVLASEEKLLELLAARGYPLAKIADRNVIVDGSSQGVTVREVVDPGPLCHFGPTKIEGLGRVRERWLRRRVDWEEGATYTSDAIEKTESTLMASGLFSSAVVTHGTTGNLLPMNIEVRESKQRSINCGVSYQTFYGPGVTFGWEDRNVRGMGRKLSLQGDITKKTHAGIATYLIPDLLRIDQDLVTQVQAMHESIFTYHQRAYSGVIRMERRIDTRYRMSAGVRVEQLFVTNSVDNGPACLLEVPLYFRFSSAKDLLNPTQGATLEYKATPSANLRGGGGVFLAQAASYASYLSAMHKDLLVFAHQIILESIVSRDLDTIPVPKRVLGGTEQELRGYRYKTVSPLAPHRRPLGGRFGLFYSLEARIRLSPKIGLVPFFDCGIVETHIIPTFEEKWMTSVGLGLRYFSFLGPLRFDMAFPLNRRKGIDPLYRLLVSIGQTF